MLGMLIHFLYTTNLRVKSLKLVKVSSDQNIK
jgi:hypothetical protein